MREQLLGKTRAEDRVWASRTKPWREADLPGIDIFPVDEQVDEDSRTTAPRRLGRGLRLAVVAVVATRDGLYDELDELAAEIEAAVNVNEKLGGAAEDAILVSSAFGTAGEREEYGAVRLTYEVSYSTCAAEDAPPAGPDFKTAHVRHNLGANVHQDDEAQDEIHLP